MDFDEILLEAEEHFEKSQKAMEHEFRRIRTGRASPAMLDHVHVEAYGTATPLNQLAGITVPEPTQLLVKPWDKNTLSAVEKAIAASDLGLSPQNDGEVIRINVPPLSEERRKQLAVQAKEATEKAKIAMRNARRDAIKAIETKGKEDKIGEDLVRQTSEQVTEFLKEYEGRLDEALSQKTEDILSI